MKTVVGKPFSLIAGEYLDTEGGNWRAGGTDGWKAGAGEMECIAIPGGIACMANSQKRLIV